MPVSSETIGSWFPTGYYGHVRSKPRSDYVCEYRQLAKPQPPCKFIARSLRRDTRHPFSLHDNRNSFLTDAVYFEQGLGRRKHPEKGPRFHQDFYTWMPLKQEIARGLPHLSTYQGSYTPAGVRQLLVPPLTCRSQEDGADTTYHYNYGEGCGHRQEVRHRSARALQLSTASRQLAARRNPPPPRDTVATCLNWTPRGRLVLKNQDLQPLPQPPAPPLAGATTPEEEGVQEAACCASPGRGGGGRAADLAGPGSPPGPGLEMVTAVLQHQSSAAPPPARCLCDVPEES